MVIDSVFLLTIEARIRIAVKIGGKSRTFENFMAAIVAVARGRLSRLLDRGDYRRPRLVPYACRVPGARCTCTRAPRAHAHTGRNARRAVQELRCVT